MAELPKLNGDERLFLQTIFTVFHQEGKWPTYNYVERTITRTHPDYDMDAIIKGLPEGFATSFKYSHRYDEEAKLIVPALYYCQEAEEELADFIRMVRHCVDRYYTFDAETPEKDILEISSNDLSNQLHMQPLTLRKMGLLLQSEYDIAFGFSCMDTECNSWRFPLKRGKLGVSRFRGVETFEQYLEQRTPLAPVQPTRNYTGQTVLQLAKNKPANDAPVVGMGDTHYHIVQGDQYNISGNAREVIFCYAHKDERLLHKLKIQLKSLQREGLVDLWYDRDISTGKEWEHEINEHLNTTQIILLLVSPDFIASDYCYGVEMERAIERHERGEARAIPIILRPTDWHNTPLGKLQALPKDGKPITLWANRDYALLDAARGIRKAVEEMSKQSVEKKATHELPTEPEKQIQQMVNARASFTIAHELAHRGFQTTDAVLGTTDKTEQERRALTPLRRENAQNLTILDDFWSQVNDSLKDYPALGNLQKYYRLAYNPLVPWTHLVWESQASLLQLEDEKVISRMYELNQNLDIFVMLRKKIQNVFDTDENKKLWNDLITWMKAYYGDDVKQREDAQWGAAGRELDRRAFQFSDSLTPLWNEINTLYHTIHSLGNPIP